MEFNPDKCKVLRDKYKIVTSNYIKHGQFLELVDSANKYLGVFFHKKLSSVIKSHKTFWTFKTILWF